MGMIDPFCEPITDRQRLHEARERIYKLEQERVYLVLETYYGQTKPIYTSKDPIEAIKHIEKRASETECERRKGLESESLIRHYSNSAAYTFDLYKLELSK